MVRQHENLAPVLYSKAKPTLRIWLIGKHARTFWHTWLTSMLLSQLSGRTAVRSLAPRSVEMIPFWSTFLIMVASTKNISPFLSTAIPKTEKAKKKKIFVKNVPSADLYGRPSYPISTSAIKSIHQVSPSSEHAGSHMGEEDQNNFQRHWDNEKQIVEPV